MVRVISVHHFAGQNIQTIEQPTACAIAPPDRLLLALASHCIEVRDLKEGSNNNGGGGGGGGGTDVLFSFPTVDEVTHLVHCLNGDYVATLETKFNRQNREINFVRVYVNWNSVATLQQSKMTSGGVSLGASECGMVQPMRARIAGRVTPTTNQSELGSLEMIEIPTKRNPTTIDCCQISGNILIVSNKLLTIYGFSVKTHDISKLRFIDFEQFNCTIELSFRPNQISICENYIACLNNSTLHMFKIVVKEPVAEVATTTSPPPPPPGGAQFPIDYKQYLNENITMNLPCVMKENSVIHKYSPFTFCDREMDATIKTDENRYEIENLIQLKMVPILIENVQGQVIEEFKSIVIKPLYLQSNLCSNVKKTGFLHSQHNNLLHSVVCMIATQQEGYLYQFCDMDSSINNSDNCIAVYPFTAPVFKLAMEDYFLHALTEAGLETYTLRIGHELCRKFEVIDNVNKACPSLNDSVCLVGLRPFLGVEQLLLSGNHLVLLASADSSPTHSIGSNSSSTTSMWTMYKLELPSPKTIFNDISIVANTHRFTSAQTYCHLMSEAHVILRTSLMLARWTQQEGNSVKLVVPQKRNVDDLAEIYRVSCALLADHFILCSNEADYMLALPYYKMALIQPYEVMKRVKKVQEQANSTNSKGLLYYLRAILLEIRYYSDADKLFGTGCKQNFIDSVLELFENHHFDDLPKLILKSAILREYSVDKLINILDKKVSNDSFEISEKSLTLALLHIQRCNHKKAKELLESINRSHLKQLLHTNWDIMFDSNTHIPIQKTKNLTFSELTIQLFPIQPDLLADLFIEFITTTKIITLNKLLKAFLDYLPASMGTECNWCSKILQKTLELYFRWYFNGVDDVRKMIFDRATSEALKILVRSYLSQLQMMQLRERTGGCVMGEGAATIVGVVEIDDKDSQQEKCDKPYYKSYFDESDKKNDGYLLEKLRWEYLDKMPPFQIEITAKLYESCMENYVVKEAMKSNAEADFVLKKLQALLCSQIVAKQLITEVNAFLNYNEDLRGNVALKTITMNVNDAVAFLIDSCPQCLLQFGKDRFTKTDEWKFLIATIQQKIIQLSQNAQLKRVCFFYKKILKDVLTHVATTMKLDELLQVFPQSLSEANNANEILCEIQDYEPYLIMCKETMHANQIKKLISTTGQQLLCTLNL